MGLTTDSCSAPRDNGKHHLEDGNATPPVDAKKARVNGSADLFKDVKALITDSKEEVHMDEEPVSLTVSETHKTSAISPSALRELPEWKSGVVPLTFSKPLIQLTVTKKADEIEEYAKKMDAFQKADEDIYLSHNDHKVIPCYESVY